MEESRIEELVSQMTLEEKASLLSGDDFWHTKAIERLGIPRMMVSDGPVGLRKQDEHGDHLGVNESIKAVCFPAGVLNAASFDIDALAKLGDTLAKECLAEDVGVILGPAMNIKRSPLCGRNFEYYSEDPTLSSKLGAAYVKAVQARGVGTSPKHFAANNQEHRRMSADSKVSMRALREIYLASFEEMVKDSKPWTVMGSYNRINGCYSCENNWLLNEVLRKEWGFDGLVVSDWGAVNDRVYGVAGGLDLEMPSSGGVGDRSIIEAVQNDELDEKLVDKAAENVLRIVMRYVENKQKGLVFDRKADHEEARKLAGQGMVLLKNKANTLPLIRGMKIAVIGCYAQKARYQGGGSAHINTDNVVSFMDLLKDDPDISFSLGFRDGQEETDPSLLEDALRSAKEADIALVFAGLPDKYESEAYDRFTMKLPQCQNDLIERLCKEGIRCAVVLHNGSPVEMPWVSEVDAILEAYLAGEATGEAEYDILFGDVNPSGKLAESFPIRCEDNPTALTFGLDGDHVDYREDIFVGYRYYDKKKMDVLFPFGYGLSYTEFEYSDLVIDKSSMKDTETVHISLKVKNIGKIKGKEVVQIYVGQKDPGIVRPVRELRAFTKVELMPGESKEVSFDLTKRAFAYWNDIIGDFHVLTGEYLIEAARSSRDIALTAQVHIDSTVEIPYRFTQNSTFGDLMERPDKMERIKDVLDALKEGFGGQGEESSDNDEGAISNQMIEAMLKYMPLRAIVQFAGKEKSAIEDIINRLNS
ncbi:glycoside hydrolase family 3 C-terminal domain-containing protein [Butyrivibrio sp. MC2013]|uniref:glycoside hydrolase family 3 C-terminal domain-containing protein n=1 Tax=Butyrivibrio sp. MC2013 TaxID=1280686 RepID=UPI0004135D14|nr:glycoside hydrolase family 3 C-terminal domain-containing protein [Butyrivibrio sp. MC2013]